MGYDRALSALYLEETDRVPQVEFLQHTDFIAKISGLNPFEYPKEAQSLAFTKLDLDMIWFTYTPFEEFIARRYKDVKRRKDSWSQAYPTEWREPMEVKSLSEILDFDPFEMWDIPSPEELTEHFKKFMGSINPSIGISLFQGEHITLA
ncbi:MAG: hypothetical protein N3E47_02040 [Candidatus Bathyarchaeota archaeon]|nr:hypothetical protein [Candidatus Bathyarchaeota archaeon]